MRRFRALASPSLAVLALLLLIPVSASFLAVRTAHADNCSWSYDPSIGQPGASGGGVLAFADLEGDLVAGGTFRRMGGQSIPFVARWNGTQWSPMGLGFSSSVNTLSWFHGSLHAFGQFLHAYPATAWRAARWDGAAWQPLGVDQGLQRPSDIQWGTANVSLVRGDSVIVGGTFTRAGDQPVGLIAAWDGTAWHSLGAGFDSLTSDSGTCVFPPYPEVRALAEYDGDLIAGGSFRLTAEGVTVHGIARWDGAVWQPLGAGMGTIAADCGPPMVHALAVWNGDLIAGGSFQTAGGTLAPRVARWDGAAWHPMGSGWATQSGAVYELTVTPGGELIAGGLAQQPDPVPNKWQLARWNGTDWEQLGPGLTDAPAPQVYTLFRWGEDLAIGGAFTSDADGDTMNYVTLLRCNATTAVGDAAGSPALALRVAGSNPFFGSVGLTFSIPADAADASLAIFDLAGRGVNRLSAGRTAAGEHRLEWNGRRDDGTRVPPGVYFARLRVGDEMASLRLVKL